MNDWLGYRLRARMLNAKGNETNTRKMKKKKRKKKKRERMKEIIATDMIQQSTLTFACDPNKFSYIWNFLFGYLNLMFWLETRRKMCDCYLFAHFVQLQIRGTVGLHPFYSSLYYRISDLCSLFSLCDNDGRLHLLYKLFAACISTLNA